MTALPAAPSATGTADPIVNLRDLGGIAAADGTRVRPRRVYRSAGPHDVTADTAAALLADLGIGLVLDLRSDHERLHRPWPTLPDGVAYGTVAVTPGPQATAPAAPATAAAAPGTTGTFGAREFGLWYGTLATASAADLAAAVRAIAAPDAPPVLIHCTAGKDRTGILVALLLDLVGVQRPEIVADYTRSQAALSEIRARTGVVVPGMDFDAMPEVVMAAPAETIETFLDTLPAGGARELLAPHGIDAATVGALRGRLLH